MKRVAGILWPSTYSTSIGASYDQRDGHDPNNVMTYIEQVVM